MTSKIMVVDDNPAIRETVRIILNSAGHEIQTVDGGTQCLEQLRAGFHGLILMDVMMPELDGWHTIAEMLKENLQEDSIICMLTAVQDPEPELEQLKEHVMDYIRKPFTAQELIERVEETIAYL